MGRTSCYCKWAGGFLFPRRVRLASASPDKGASSWPAVSPPDHRVLGGAWGARLWLWGNRLEEGWRSQDRARQAQLSAQGTRVGPWLLGTEAEVKAGGGGSQGRPKN